MLTSASSDRYLIKNAEIWASDGRQPQRDILVEGGTIAAIEPSESAKLSADVTIDATGLQLLPAGVDAQVHLRVPGQAQKETAETGLAAAVRGGYAAVLNMPNTKPVIDSVEVCDQARSDLARATAEYGVEAYLTASITTAMLGKQATDYDQLANWGIKAFTDDGLGVESDDRMREVFAASERHGIPVLQHAEFKDHPGVLAAGPTQEALAIPAYPESAEVDMVARDLRILKEEYPHAVYHVLHVSSLNTLKLVTEARDAGLRVSCEVSPHHLFFCSDDIPSNKTSFKMNPPLRSPHDREDLQRGLADGRIQFVATDHAPHEAEAKSTNFKTAAFGTTGLETSLRVLIDLLQRKMITPERLVEVFSHAPARFLGIDDEFGRIEAGRQMRGVLIDAQAAAVPVVASDLESLSHNNCFLDTPLPAAVRQTLIGCKLFTPKPSAK